MIRGIQLPDLFLNHERYAALQSLHYLAGVIVNFIRNNRSILLYGLCLAGVLVLLNWLKLRFIMIDHAFEIYIGAIALIFTGVGIWVGLKMTRPKIRVVNQIVDKKPFTLNEEVIRQRNITRRELEVLQLMAEGLSNQEIADRLFLSLSTVKSHSNSLFDKLDVRRRTQAIDHARKIQLIP